MMVQIGPNSFNPPRPTEVYELRFAWPEAPEPPFREDFFFGAWHPSTELHLRLESPPKGVSPVVVQEDRYALVSNSSELHKGAGQVQMCPPTLSGGARLLAFRGYLLDPPLHSWSSPRLVYDYWQGELVRLHNGVFATARILPDRLELLTDAFGISPLYYRLLNNGTVLFATNARYLRVEGDAGIDPVAARMLLHRGALCADRSLAPHTTRCKPGHVVTFTNLGKTETPWFRFDALPVGAKPITAENLCAAEEVFQQAIDRCLRLMPGTEQPLPLSSGDDSRRILAALLTRRVPFQALTVRVRQKEYRDLDGRFSSEMAHELGFSHEVIELPDTIQTAKDHHITRTLYSSELLEHSWIPPLIRCLHPHASLVFDGLGGDVFGNTGFAAAEWHTMPEHGKLEKLACEFLPSWPNSPYRENAFVTIQQAREELIRHLSILPEAPNRADYAFALTRARRGTGPGIQQLLPPGYIPVYPYFDLDHIRVTMELNSLEKVQEKLQARCLRIFWPDIYRFPGSR